MARRRSLPFIGLLVLMLLSCEATAGLPNPFATATPTATPTFTPSPTPSPTPTATLTPTPPPTGVFTETLADDATHFVDYDAGYEMLTPRGWTVIPIDAVDIQKAASALGNNNPDIKNAIEQLSQLDPNSFRLFVLDTDPAHFVKGLVTNITVFMVKDKMSAALPMDMLLSVNLENIKSTYPSVKVISSEVKKNAGGVEIGLLEVRLPLSKPNGTSIVIYEKQCYIKANDGITILTFATPQNMKDVTTPAFDLLIDSIKLLSR